MLNETDTFEYCTSTFVYNDNNYNYYYNSGDSSGRGCLTEIVYNNEYNLDKFKNIKGTIIDIGGNSGVATIILAKQNPDSKIYSYEPDHNLYLNIIKNVQINNLNNVYVFNIAVSDKNGVCQLSKFPSMTGANTIYANNKFIDYTRNTVINNTIKTISLDTLINEHKIKSIDLLKIDCEGAEYNIIYGSNLFKKNIVKNMVGEFHDLKYTDTLNNSDDLIKYCKLYIKEPNILSISVLRNL